jgi:zinc protease
MSLPPANRSDSASNVFEGTTLSIGWWKETAAIGAAPAKSGHRVEPAWSRSLLLILGVVTIAWAVPADAQRAELEKRIRRATLDNGLEVIVVENRGVPLVTVEAVVRNGAFVQTPEMAGLAHLYEHMIFGANSQYPTAEHFLARLASLGADYNGSTSEERVNYYLTLSSDSLVAGMEALGAALMSPSFRPEEMDRERQVVIGEYDRNESEPFYHFQRDMARALWGEAWPRKNALGEREVIRAATPERMREIQRRYYVPNNTALIIAGDASADAVFDLARTIFGGWPRGEDPFVDPPLPQIPPLRTDGALVVEQPIGSVVVMRQWHGPSARGDVKSTYAADVFSDVMNQRGSKFRRALVDAGHFQSLQVHYYTLNHTGPITIFAETAPEKLREALAALDAELRRTVDPGYITAADLAPVKRQRVAGTLYSLERASGFAHQLGFWWSVTGLEYFLGYVDAMAEQSPDDLRAYARRYIVGKPSITGVLVSPETRAQMGLGAHHLLPTRR